MHSTQNLNKNVKFMHSNILNNIRPKTSLISYFQFLFTYVNLGKITQNKATFDNEIFNRPKTFKITLIWWNKKCKKNVKRNKVECQEVIKLHKRYNIQSKKFHSSKHQKNALIKWWKQTQLRKTRSNEQNFESSKGWIWENEWTHTKKIGLLHLT